MAADEVWLFGSHARKESNGTSDVDVLVVCEGVRPPLATMARLRRRFGAGLDVAHYSYGGLQELAAKASLFAWHLRHEGIPLWRRSDRLEGILADMRPYAGHSADLGVLVKLFEDAVGSLAGRHAVHFDLGVVATVVRNTGIIVHDLFGSRDFSPDAPIRLASVPGAPELSIGEVDYGLLQACRRASERGEPVAGVPAADALDSVIEAVRQWLGDCMNEARRRGG